MDFALFNPPFDRPERSPRQIFDWAVDQAVEAEQAGFTEYWVGEHSTLHWESIPSPELVLSAAARETERIKLCPGAHLLPYHHPATLASQTSWLSHLTQGRYILGIGAGAYPSDAALHGLTDLSENHDMMLEALDIMQRVWSGEPFHFEGKYWKAGFPEAPEGGRWRDLRPYGDGIPIAMAAISPNSSTMRFAGSNGYLPLSVFAGEARVKNHWEVYEAAATEAGRVVSRKDFRVTRDIVCADTDKEARRIAVDGGIGRAWKEYLLGTYKSTGILRSLIPDPDVDPLEVDIDYLADNVWITGSPDTVVEKLQASMDANGGWGTTLLITHDFMDDPAPWNASLRLLAEEVGPRLQV